MEKHKSPDQGSAVTHGSPTTQTAEFQGQRWTRTRPAKSEATVQAQLSNKPLRSGYDPTGGGW